MDRENKTHPQDAAGYATKNAGCETRAAEFFPKDFGFALDKLWDCKQVFRQKWNGKGMYLKLQIPDPGSKMTQPYIYIRTADNQLVPWVASQSDLLAHDWEVFR